MKKKISVWTLIVSLVLSIMSPITAVQAINGDGTTSNPFIITTCAELQNMKNNLSASYALGNDIDCSDTVNWNGGKGFQPVGDGTNKFKGTFNGQNYSINGLVIAIPDQDNLGLFGYAEGPGVKIQNVTLKDLTMTSNKGFSAALVGYAWTGVEITNIRIENTTLKTGDYVGGIAGYFRGEKIDNVYVSGTVKGDSKVGGLVGKFAGDSKSVISRSSFNGTLTGSSSVGGIAGEIILNGFVDESYSTGSITCAVTPGTGKIGGLIGYLKTTTTTSGPNHITNSFSHMDVNCPNYVDSVAGVGGLIGYFESGKIDKTYSTGKVTGKVSNPPANSQGGLIGKYLANASTGSVTNSYWDKTSSGLTTSAGSKGIGKTTAEMKTQSTFSTWDFSKKWFISPASNNGYPSMYREVTSLREVNTANSVTLTWDSPTNPIYSSVNVYRNGVKVGAGSISSYLDTGLTSDTDYMYILKVVDMNGKESPGEQITVHTYDNIPPSTVSNVVIEEKDDGIYLNWTNPSDSDLQGVSVTRNGQLLYTGLATSFKDVSYNEKTSYTYQVRAYDENGNMSLPTSNSITSLDKTPPGEVTNLQAEDRKDGTRLTWTNPIDDDFTYVRIYKNNSLIENTLQTGEWLDKDVTEKETNTYLIQTVDNVGNVSHGVEKSVYVEDKTPPAEVTNLETEDRKDGTRLTWTNPTDIDFTYIRIYKNHTLIEDVLQTEEWLDKDITEKETNTYLIQTVDDAGNVSHGLETSMFVKDKTPPAEVSDLQIEDRKDGTRLTWTKPTDDDFTYVRIYKNDTLIKDALQAGEWLDRDVTEKETNVYLIQTIDDAGNVSHGSETSVFVKDKTPPAAVGSFIAKKEEHANFLSWTLPSDADFKEVQLTRNGIEIYRGNLTYFRDTSIEKGNYYVYGISSIDDSGNPSSQSFRYVLTDFPLENIQKVQVTEEADGVLLKWANPQGDIGWKVQIYRDNELLSETTRANYYKDSTTTPYQTFTYTLQVIDKYGNKLLPVSVSLQTKDRTPSMIRSLKATNAQDTVNITWTYSSAPFPSYFIVYRNGKFLTSTTYTTFTDENVTPGATYSYGVRAVSITGLLSMERVTFVGIPVISVPVIIKPPILSPITPPEVIPEPSKPTVEDSVTPPPSLPQIISTSDPQSDDEKEEQVPQKTNETKKPKTTSEKIAHSVVVKKSKKGIVLKWKAPKDMKKVLIYRDNVLIGETTETEFEDILQKTSGTVHYKIVFVRANGKKITTHVTAKVKELAREVGEKASLEDSRLSQTQMWEALLPSAGLMVVFVGAAVWVSRRKVT